jgi:hypothetical protein
MPLCAVTKRMRGCQRLLLWQLVCARIIRRSSRRSSERLDRRSRGGHLASQANAARIAIFVNIKRVIAHAQVKDLMKLPGRVNVGRPGSVTGGKCR